MEQDVSIQIGSYSLRDPTTNKYMSCCPLYKKVNKTTRESIFQNIVNLIIDCYKNISLIKKPIAPLPTNDDRLTELTAPEV